VVNSNEEHPVDEGTVQETTEEVVEPVEEVITEVVEENPEGYGNAIGRIVGVFMDPVRAMGDVVFKRGWLAPFLFFLIALTVFNLVAGDIMAEYGMEQGRERIQNMVAEGRISQDQADQIMEQQMGGNVMKVMMFVNPLIAVMLLKLIIALIAMLVGNILLGGNMKYKNYWSTVWYASVIGSLAMIITSILVSVTGDVQGAQLGLGILTKADPTSTAHKIAQVFNVFTLWEATILGIGVAKLAKAPLVKGIVWMLIFQIGIGLATSLLFGQAMV
jgi:hypothetical protein